MERLCVLLVWWQERYIERFSCFGENRRKIHTLHEYGGYGWFGPILLVAS